MCGINGIIHTVKTDDIETKIISMNKSIKHRGPDDEGVWVDNQIALGHVRLSIIDLSPAGKQPMFSQNKRFVLVFNGEIYNFKKLKEFLKSYIFSSNTDTEVILAGWEKWGTELLQKLEGMFAFCLYDKEKGEVYLVRDRMGIKPVYYSKSEKELVFSSEIRGVLSSELVPRRLNRSKLHEYFSYGTLHGENTLVENVFLLEPGTYLKWSKDTHKTETIHWWSNNHVPRLKPAECSYEEAKNKAKTLFYSAVEKRMIADVPFGAFLSGGIDSGLVTAVMSQVSTTKVNTFNISFSDPELSEAAYARKVAEKFQTNHHEIVLKPQMFLDSMDDILKAYDHPGADGPNTYIVSKATKDAGITMALSGLGGDELFGGYPVFQYLPHDRKLKTSRLLPNTVRQLLGFLLPPGKTARMKKQKALLKASKIDDATVYRMIRENEGMNEVEKLVGLSHQSSDSVQFFEPKEKDHFISQISRAEFYHYLQSVLLRDTDQMSMASALEVRVPFLDHHLVEFVLSLPDEYKQKQNIPKSLLVESLSNLLPEEVIYRKKMGFVLPWKQWIKAELRYKVEEAINLVEELNIGIKSKWASAYEDFLSGGDRYHWNMFWTLVTLTDWMKQNKVK
jgi:asparagine synthase (glutamine-hydrolysing)